MPIVDEAPRFTTIKDWHDFINKKGNITGSDLYSLRQRAYNDIEESRDRPLIVYATAFLNESNSAHVSINLNDVDGFIDLVSSVGDVDEVDVLVHSPGGAPDATERIVGLLRNEFDEVNFLVPHSAYSAATMLSLSGDEIILHPSASLGPIDPQVDGTPTRTILRGFEKVRDLLRGDNADAVTAYLPLIKKYTLDFLEQCEDAERLSKSLATEWLSSYMFGDEDIDDKEEVIGAAVRFFANYDKHKIHSRPLTYNKLDHLGLNIRTSGGDMSKLLREAYILLNGMFQVSPFVKLYEDSNGLSWGPRRTPQPSPQPDDEDADDEQ